MLNLLYEKIYRSQGVRTPANLAEPKVHLFDEFIFPKDSLFHYFNDASEIVQPNLETNYFKQSEKIFMLNSYELLSYPVKVTKKTTGIQSAIKKFHQENKRFKLINQIDNDIIENYLVVVNHEWHKETAVIKLDRFKEYQRIQITLASLKSAIKFSALSSDRYQFIFLDLPDKLPGIQEIKKINAGVVTPEVKEKDLKTFLLIELFRWINLESRLGSIFDIPSDHFYKINLLIKYKNIFTILNLGYIDKIIKKKESEMSSNLIPVTTGDLLLNKVNALVNMQYPGQRVTQLTLAGLIKIINQGKSGLLDASENTFSIREDIEDETVDDEKLTREVEKTLINEVEAQSLVDNEKETTWENPPVIKEPENNKIALSEAMEVSLKTGNIGSTTFKRLKEKEENFYQLSDPFNGARSIADAINVTLEDLEISDIDKKIPDSETVVDKRQLETSLNVFDKSYIEKLYRRDQLRMIDMFQRAGIIVDDYYVENKLSAVGETETHILKLHPVDGNPSTIKFKLPTIQSNGKFKYNNTEYILRKQKSDIPIRKISPARVALSSYYGKLFVFRNERSSANIVIWLKNQILKRISEDPENISADENDKFEYTKKAPRAYMQLAQSFSYIELKTSDGQFKLAFNKDIKKKLRHDWKNDESGGNYFVGVLNNNTPVFIDDAGIIYINKNANKHIFELLGLPINKLPKEEALVKVMGVEVPLLYLLGSKLGLKTSLDTLNIKYKVGKESTSGLEQFNKIRFKDQNLIWDKSDIKANLLLNPLLKQKDKTRNIEIKTLNTADGYFDLIEAIGGTVRTVQEIDLINKMFIDPITKDVLESIKEPTTFDGLLIRSLELITTEDYPATTDMDYMRIKGYERINGMIYKEIVKSIRDYQRRTIRSRMQIEMNPHSVWTTLAEDPTVKITEGTNPIQQLKEQESITMSGYDGRSKDSMSKPTRIFHKSDMGIVSESTVDSGDVGVSNSLTANPVFKNVRGIKADFDYQDIDPNKLLSTTSLLSASVNKDDPKRVNFVSIQHSHTIANRLYHPPLIRTGYEKVLPHRTDSLYAYTAKKPGKVISRTNQGIVIEYKDNERIGIKLGTIYGRAEGSYYPHEIVSDLNIGDKFDIGDPISYNTGFFERDIFEPNRLIFKTTGYVKTALTESLLTHEDSSGISERLSKEMVAKTTKVKNITVRFDQNIVKAKQVGDYVEPDSILMYIHDDIENESNLSDEALKSLEVISANTPTAKVKGTIKRIEVYYNGEKKSMSSTTRKIANQFDALLKEEQESIGNVVVTGQVDQDYRPNGDPLEMSTMEIKYFIEVDNVAGVGEKLVFAHQMKSVIGEVMSGKVETESGEEIDAMFGMRSINARVVLSPIELGTTAALLEVIAKKAVELAKL